MLSLDKLCDYLEISVHPFAVCGVNKGEKLKIEPRDEATVHYVVAGRGTLSFPGFSNFHLNKGVRRQNLLDS